MKKLFFPVAIATVFMAAPAFADCLADVGKAEEAMKSMQVDQAKADEAKALVDQAKTFHSNGDNSSCETTAKQLMTLLGMQTSQ